MKANVSIPTVGARSERRIYIEDIYPAVDAGRFAVKRIAGEPIEVWADIFRDGHAVLAADLLWRPESGGRWSRIAMRPPDNDRWQASFTPPTPGRYLYAIEAWTDLFATWRRDVLVKRAAGLDVALETREGRDLLGALIPRNQAHARVLWSACQTSD